MSWTDERIQSLKRMWEAGQTASQIAEALGEGVSRNAVIGKAHRLGLQARPSPVKPASAAAPASAPTPVPTPAEAPVAAPAPAELAPRPEPAPVAAKPVSAPVAAAPAELRPVREQAQPAAPVAAPPVPPVRPTAAPAESLPVAASAEPANPAATPAPPPQPVLRSIGPGGFLRQSPGEQQPPSTPAPPRRLVPAKPSPEMAGKTSLLDLNDRVCKWPLGHPGEPDFHFCGDKVNPGFPYCVEHCGHAYQAQLPRRDRRPPPPLPFGGPRVR